MDDTTRLMATGTLVGVAACLCIMAELAQTAMTDAVNLKLPQGSQISHLGSHLGKALHLRREYRRFYPEGRLIRRFDVLTACAMLFLASATAVLFQFIG